MAEKANIQVGSRPIIASPTYKQGPLHKKRQSVIDNMSSHIRSKSNFTERKRPSLMRETSPEALEQMKKNATQRRMRDKQEMMR